MSKAKTKRIFTDKELGKIIERMPDPPFRLPMMRVQTLGFIIFIIGTIGVAISNTTGLLTQSFEYFKMGMGANIIQLLGIVFMHVDKD